MKRLAELRTMRGWSQGQLAKQAKLPQPSIARFELGEREPLLSHLRKLAAAFDMTLTEFVANVVEAPSGDGSNADGKDGFWSATGRRLAALRRSRGESIGAFSKAVGIPADRWELYEAGRAYVVPEDARLIFQMTGFPMAWIYWGVRSGLPSELAEEPPIDGTPAAG